MDIGTAWRRLVTPLVGLLAQDLGAAALVTLEGTWGISGRIIEAVRVRLHELQVDNPRALEAWAGLRP
eukprot:10815885-Alexandrium_andersonii.AAC.1